MSAKRWPIFAILLFVFSLACSGLPFGLHGAGGTTSLSDPEKDLVNCETGEAVPPVQVDQMSPRMRVDFTRVDVRVVQDDTSTATFSNGKMCFYEFAITLTQPIQEKTSLEFNLSFQTDTLEALYAFSYQGRKTFISGSVRNVDTESKVTFNEGLQDFQLKIEDNLAIARIPCYAVPWNGSTTWFLETFDRTASGHRHFCDRPGEYEGAPQTLPAPSMFMRPGETLRLEDPNKDVLNMTKQRENEDFPPADIAAMEVHMTDKGMEVGLEMWDEFPPSGRFLSWSTVLRSNFVLSGLGPLLCSRDPKGKAGWLDPQTDTIDPTHPWVSYQDSDRGPQCTFAPTQGLPDSSCAVFSGDFYVTDENQIPNVQYKDRVGRILICFTH